MAVTLSLFAGAGAQFFTDNGVPLAGGKIYSYYAGTTTPLATYTANSDAVTHTNPIILDSAGRVPSGGEIWLQLGIGYKFVVKTSADITVATYDNVPSSAPPAAANDADSIAYEQGYTVTAGNFVVGKTYRIVTVGTTNFMLIGATSNSIGTHFVASGVGSGTGTAELATTVEAKLRETVSVKDFGAVGNNIVDDTAAIQAALDYASNLSSGATVYVPAGTYKCTAQLNIYRKTILCGEGMSTSVLEFTHNGIGIKSTFPINSSSAAFISLRDIGLLNNTGTNTSGGYVDVGGSYVTVDHVAIQGFKHGIIFDQTEVASITSCNIIANITNGTCIWLTNGNYTAGAAINYTNRITILSNQLNAVPAAAANILDDGGVNHSIRDNNLNAGEIGLRAAGVFALVFSGNESEVHENCDIFLADTRSDGTYVGPCQGPDISGNTLISATGGSNVKIQNCSTGNITSNLFGQANSAIIFLNGASNYSTGIVIEGNNKLLLFTPPALPSKFFFDGFTNIIDNQIIRQTAVTYVASSLSAGTVTVTPAAMELIYPGSTLVVKNNDGSNSEIVVVTATTATTFTATFASNKSSNFLVFGATPYNQFQNVWTPSLYGLITPGTNTYTTRTGRYYKQGNLVTVQATIIVSAVDAAMDGALYIGNLPFVPNSGGFVGTVQFEGFTFSAGYTQIICATVANLNAVALGKCGSGVVLENVYKTDIPGTTCKLIASLQYTTNS